MTVEHAPESRDIGSGSGRSAGGEGDAGGGGVCAEGSDGAR